MLNESEIIGKNMRGRLTNLGKKLLKSYVTGQSWETKMEPLIITGLVSWFLPRGKELWMPEEGTDVDAFSRNFNFDDYIPLDHLENALIDLWIEELGMVEPFEAGMCDAYRGSPA